MTAAPARLATLLSIALLAPPGLRADGDYSCEGEYRTISADEGAFVRGIQPAIRAHFPAVAKGWESDHLSELDDPKGRCVHAGDPIQTSMRIRYRLHDGLEDRFKAIAQAYTAAQKEHDFEAESKAAEPRIRDIVKRIEAATAKMDMKEIEKLQAEMQAASAGMTSAGEALKKASAEAERKYLHDTQAAIEIDVNGTSDHYFDGGDSLRKIEVPGATLAYEMNRAAYFGDDGEKNGSMGIFAFVGSFTEQLENEGAVRVVATRRPGAAPHAVHSMSIEIEGVPERARALLAALDVAALAGLLQRVPPPPAPAAGPALEGAGN